MKGFVVYEIRNIVNGKRYVGSAVDSRVRFQRHRRDLRKGKHINNHLQSAWDKYGEDAFKFVVLASYDNDKAMHEAEERIIRTEWDENHTKLYNAKIGVARAPLHPQEVKDKISVRVREEHTKKRGVYKGYKQSAEHSAKISEALQGNTCAKGYKRTDAEKAVIAERMTGNQNWLGRKHSEASKDKMGITAYAVAPDGTETRYVSINAMREALGMAGLSNLLNAIRTGLPLEKGDYAGWVFYTELEDNRVEVPEEFTHLPRTRQQAMEQGVAQYFSGKPCKRGHVYARAKKGTCILCRREDEKAKRNN